ncbi:MAG: phenylalanine--tRNA ligase subunit alpha [Bdellovibrionaceae bacterium]|nr:phenylalanine--tRNA ligase subunit alpha [Pseudobdellovibrionaceae bacterium]
MLSKKLQDIQNQAQKEINEATTLEALYQVKVRFLGKQGELTLIMKDMGGLSKEERPAFGKLVNEVKQAVTTLHDEKESQLARVEMDKKLSEEELDLTLPGPYLPNGSEHLIAKVMNEIVDILARVGFSVRTGPLIETDFYNFTALNIPADHPSRDMQDTFYIDGEHVLRTHTSPIQIRTMQTEKPPIRILAPGGVFRHDYDASHSPHFHQIEALLVDKNVSMADLKGTISYFIREFFGKNIKTRFRPSFFPFTEPSAEVDCSCPLCQGKGCKMCKHTGWIEIGGSGLVHPNVFKAAGLDPEEWQGFAFGFGIERMAIIKYGVSDIRLFMENDTRFLEQFK